MKKYLKFLLLIFVPLLIVYGGLSLSNVDPQVHAANASNFDPGRIIDDAVFFNEDSMSASEIQKFLDSKMPGCETNHTEGTHWKDFGQPYTCLKDYREDPTIEIKDCTDQEIKDYFGFDSDDPEYEAAKNYCWWEDGRTNLQGETPGSEAMSAAEIIHYASQQYGINPKVLIVTLHKEQNLIKDTWPWVGQYQKAMGYACPDTAACDPQFRGFYNQVTSAAWQLKRYVSYPEKYNYAVGENFVQYHPNSSCDGSIVDIRTSATAALYNYTPYQPNQASLDAYPGEGNSCSSYGNRNFWFQYNDWFGSTHSNIDYGWRLEAAEVYLKSDMTKKFTKDEIVLLPGETAYIRVKAHNIGNESWAQSKTRLGTWNKRDRNSVFAGETWLSPTRASEPEEAEIVPGTFGIYEFSITAPEKLGTYKEAFNVVAEGKKWMKNEGLAFTIHVTTEVKPTETNNILKSGEEITRGQYLLSSDTYNSLALGGKSLKLASNFDEIWLKKSSKTLKRLVMQGDGNLVLYDTNGNPVWHTQTNNNPGARFALQHDGNMVVYSSNNTPLWTSDTVQRPHMLKHVGPSLPTGKLFPGQKLETADRKRKLVIQSDGNLVLYEQGKALWATYTVGENIKYLAMQGDGNLVLYNTDGKAVWHTRTGGMGASRLVLQDDSNLVLYRKSNSSPTWHTGTY